MEFINIQNDYTWVVKVLESCLTESQVDASEKIFKQFLGKWGNELPDERREKLIYNFDKLVKSKTVEIRKNYSPNV
jgi:hypothetical protein|tara:strand:- start:531 stop:758 length:228 start_codon:yes stop_codon:yes gene_type:complete